MKDNLVQLFIESEHLITLMDVLLVYSPRKHCSRNSNSEFKTTSGIWFHPIWEGVYAFLVKLLNSITRFEITEFDIHERLLAAFKYYKSKSTETSTFEDLISGLKLEFNDSYLTSIFQLVNYLLASSKDTDNRISIQNQFSLLGMNGFISDFLCNTRSLELSNQVQYFMELRSRDQINSPSPFKDHVQSTYNTIEKLQDSDHYSNILQNLSILSSQKDPDLISKLNFIDKSIAMYLSNPNITVPNQFMDGIDLERLFQGYSAQKSISEQIDSIKENYEKEIETLKRKLTESTDLKRKLTESTEIVQETKKRKLEPRKHDSNSKNDPPSSSGSLKKYTSLPKWKLQQLKCEKEAKEKLEREKEIKRQKINDLMATKFRLV